MSFFSKKKPPPKDDNFQTANPPVFVSPKATDKASISPYQNELLLRGKIGLSTGVSEKSEKSKKPEKKEEAKPDTLNTKSDILESETEYAQIMKINIEQKFDKSME